MITFIKLSRACLPVGKTFHHLQINYGTEALRHFYDFGFRRQLLSSFNTVNGMQSTIISNHSFIMSNHFLFYVKPISTLHC